MHARACARADDEITKELFPQGIITRSVLGKQNEQAKEVYQTRDKVWNSCYRPGENHFVPTKVLWLLIRSFTSALMLVFISVSA